MVSRKSLRWLVLGEDGHGTNEMPRTVADMVCAAAAANRPVTVGVEFRTRNQPALDAYMASDGGTTASAELLAAQMWDADWADGKSSLTMLVLFEWLRTQRRNGVVADVVAFDADMSRDGTDRERQMAQRLKAKAPSGMGIFIVLTGSFHARKRLSDAETTPFPPMATMLPRAQTVSLRVQGNGGRIWACTQRGCGEQDANRSGGTRRGLSLRKLENGSYDGAYDLGLPVTPSPPVKQKSPGDGPISVN